MLTGNPVVKIVSSEFSMPGELEDQHARQTEIHKKIPALARTHGESVVKEEAVAALHERKLVDTLRDYLAKQAGVTQVPAIVVAYK